MNDDEILRRTSRSFHLTLRLLPRAVRGEASLGYLLARATDAMADTSLLDPAVRVAALRAVSGALGRSDLGAADTGSWARAQRDPAERRLIEELPALWARLAASGSATRGRLEPLLRTIIEGQLFDLERFGADAPALTPGELERYTHLVAGCVGEFWTDLCADRLPGFAREPVAVMRGRGCAYGQGLQLVNILRDRNLDAAVGRIYVNEADVPARTAQARRHLEEGGLYCAALTSGRLRYATLLPALFGLRTLALEGVHATHPLTPRKISRHEVRQWMRRALPAWWSARAVGRLIREARDAPVKPGPSRLPRG